MDLQVSGVKFHMNLIEQPLGRPSKLTPERVERICGALRRGHSRSTAAVLAGIGKSTFFAWMAVADGPDAPQDFVDFREAIKMAEAEGERELVDIIRSAAASTWTAAAWLLERKFPDRWAKRIKANVAIEPPAGYGDDVLRNIAESKNAAELAARTADYARRGVPFESWDPDAQALMRGTGA